MQEETNYPIVNPSPDYNTKYTADFRYVPYYIDYEAMRTVPAANYYSEHIQREFDLNEFDYLGTPLVYRHEDFKLLEASRFHVNYQDSTNTEYAVSFKNTRLSFMLNQSDVETWIRHCLGNETCYTLSGLNQVKFIDYAYCTLVALPPDEYNLSQFRDLVIVNRAQIISSFIINFHNPSTFIIPQFTLYPQWRLYAFVEYHCKGNLSAVLIESGVASRSCVVSMDVYLDTTAEIIVHEDKEEENLSNYQN